MKPSHKQCNQKRSLDTDYVERDEDKNNDKTNLHMEPVNKNIINKTINTKVTRTLIGDRND